MATKKTVKKVSAPAKKQVVAAKKTALVKKSASTKKAQAPASAQTTSKKAAKKEIKRVPPRIVRKPVPVAKPAETEYKPIDTAKAVAFAMSIAQEMKRSAAKAEQERRLNEIRLTRRPTTRVQGRDSIKFPAADLKEFKRRLLEARAVAANGVNDMRATGFNESGDHEADGGDGTDQTLRLQALGQMGSISRTIQQIDEALHRIADGTYGVCTACGQLIRKPRLLNQPFVQTCMECQSAMERGTK